MDSEQQPDSFKPLLESFIRDIEDARSEEDLSVIVNRIAGLETSDSSAIHREFGPTIVRKCIEMEALGLARRAIELVNPSPVKIEPAVRNYALCALGQGEVGKIKQALDILEAGSSGVDGREARSRVVQELTLYTRL